MVPDECRWLHPRGYSSRAGLTETTLGVCGTWPTHHRWLADDETVSAERAEPELKVLEVVVEVERRRVVDVLRILPVRHQADENGHSTPARRCGGRRSESRLSMMARPGSSAAPGARVEQVAPTAVADVKGSRGSGGRAGTDVPAPAIDEVGEADETV